MLKVVTDVGNSMDRKDDVVAMLETLLMRARRGEVDNIMIVAHVGVDFCSHTICAGDTDMLRFLGALEHQKYNLLAELTSATKHT